MKTLAVGKENIASRKMLAKGNAAGGFVNSMSPRRMNFNLKGTY